MRIDRIGPQGVQEQFGFPKQLIKNEKVPSFKETLVTFMNDVNDSQKASSEAQLKLLSGEINDVHHVMNKSQEANVAFNMLMELRNKTLDSYNEIQRLRL